MKRRRNADDTLRKLHRKSLSGDIQDVINYWQAALRAGQLPEPTRVDAYGDSWWEVSYLSRPSYEGKQYEEQYKVNRLTRLGGWRIGWGRDLLKIAPWQLSYWKADSKEHADFLVKNRLEAFISWYTAHDDPTYLLSPNPRKRPLMKRRRNADDALRAAERFAATEGTPEAIKAYWRKALQAGQLPKPTFEDRDSPNLRRDGGTYNVNNPDAATWGEWEGNLARLPRVVLHVFYYPIQIQASVFFQNEGEPNAFRKDYNSIEQAEKHVKKLLTELVYEA